MLRFRRPQKTWFRTILSGRRSPEGVNDQPGALSVAQIPSRDAQLAQHLVRVAVIKASLELAPHSKARNRMKRKYFACTFALLVALSGVADAQGAANLSTGFAGGNGLFGNMFDVTVTAPVVLNDIDINLFVGTATIEVYIVLNGTHVGNEINPAYWGPPVFSVNVTSAAANAPTPLGLGSAFVLPPGTHAFYVTSTGGPILSYTNGTAVGTVLATDPFLTIFEGIGNGYPFMAPIMTRNWNGTIYYTPATSLQDDMACFGVPTPRSAPSVPGCPSLALNEQVTMNLVNLGTNPLPGSVPLPVEVTIDDGVTPFTIQENYITPAAGMPQFASDTYTFATTFDLSGPGTYYDITCRVLLPGDNDTSNDATTITGIYSGGSLPIPWSENFDALGNGVIPPIGWEQDLADNPGFGLDSDWIFTNLPTPSGPPAGPPGDATTGMGTYAYAEDGTNFTSINIISPCIDLQAASNPLLTFSLYSNDPTPNTASNVLNIDILDANNNPISAAAFSVGSRGPNWQAVCFDLTPFVASGVIRIGFNANTSAGFGISQDIGIDDISVFEASTYAGGGGASSVPGRALLDINRARETSGFGVECRLPGPYTAMVPGNGTLNIRIEGVAGQPFLLLAGPLTVGVATLPPIGQFDVGVFNPSPPFFPTVNILFDGTQPGLAGAFYTFGADGVWAISQALPGLPPGPLIAFQAVNLTGDAQIAQTTNAVDVIIL